MKFKAIFFFLACLQSQSNIPVDDIHGEKALELFWFQEGKKTMIFNLEWNISDYTNAKWITDEAGVIFTYSLFLLAKRRVWWDMVKMFYKWFPCLK